MADNNMSWREQSFEGTIDESEESFVINSDNDIPKKVNNNVIQYSDEEEMDEEVESMTSAQVQSLRKPSVTNDERLTPLIRRAIRRSIHQLSKDSSDEESTEKDPNIVPESDEEISNGEEEPEEIEHVGSSDEEYQPEVVRDTSELDESMSGLRIDRKLKKGSTAQPIEVDSSSDDDKENDSGNKIKEDLAMSMAQEEARNSFIDPVTAQKKALLLIKKQQIEEKLLKTRMLYKTGNVNVLPDNGERLRMSIYKDETELERILNDLKKIETDGERLNRDKLPEIKKPLFKNGTLDIDPTYLKPTLSQPDKDLGKKAQATFEREQTLTVERLQDLHGSLQARPSPDQLTDDPRGLKISLMQHQKSALTWLLWREKKTPPGGVLADDMGLGKTLTMISLIIAAKTEKDDKDASDEDEWLSSSRGQKFKGGTLVIAPASLVAQWEAEVKNRCKRGLLTVELHHGNRRETKPKRLAQNDIVVTTYNLVSREFKTTGILFKIRWRRVILDEAHVIRNHKSQTCESVCGLSADKRWVLTGTPVQNKEMDLFAILKFLRCSPFDDVRVWKRWVDNKNDAGHERLATVMKSIMLRRTKVELQEKGQLQNLPDKEIELIEVPLDPEERLIYDKVMIYSKTLFAQFLYQRAEKAHNFEMGGGGFNRPQWNAANAEFTKAQKKLLSMHADVQSHEILVLLLRLRQVCCHPSLINSMLDRDDIENAELEGNAAANASIDLMTKINDLTIDEDDGETGVDKRVTGNLLTADNPVFDVKRRSSKIRAVLEKVTEIVEKEDKLIIVSQWCSVLDLIATELNSMEEITYEMFTGKVPVKDRQGIMETFNDRRSKVNVLLLSLTAGGVGLNLVGANHLLLIDIHWNPQLECQAQDRIYRFGQTKDVFIYKYICTDTIEERIKGLQERKMEIASNVLGGGGKSASGKLSLDEMKSLFGL